MRIAIIGGGISGCLSARLLSTRHDVTLFESSDYPGGHAQTVSLDVDGRRLNVDTAFMVYNQRTYPNFCRLLNMLGVASQPTDMSFSVRCSRRGLEYQGSSLNGLFAQRANLFRPSFHRMLTDILQFNARARSDLRNDAVPDDQSAGDYLDQCRLGRGFRDLYLAPMAAAIWSCDPASVERFPARFLIGFLANHGLLQIRDRPQWRTIAGGSQQYVRALLEPIVDSIRLRCRVVGVRRFAEEAVVRTIDGHCESFDRVVFATHADQTLNILDDATREEASILSAFPYRANEAVLHTDARLLPRRRRAWASWNYHVSPSADQRASVTYDLSRLQNHPTATPLLLTLNETSAIDPAKVLRTFTYSHPAYGLDSARAQGRFLEISGRRRSHYCGAYWGYGFHEDGVNSALAVAQQFALTLDACTVASTKEPLLTGV